MEGGRDVGRGGLVNILHSGGGGAARAEGRSRIRVFVCISIAIRAIFDVSQLFN